MNKKKQFVVWGLGRFGASVAETLVGMGHEVLGIDHDEEVVQEMADKLTHVVVSEAIDETVVKSLGLRNFDAAIIAIGDLEPSLLCCMILKEAGMATILAKASSEIHGKMLKNRRHVRHLPGTGHGAAGWSQFGLYQHPRLCGTVRQHLPC